MEKKETGSTSKTPRRPTKGRVSAAVKKALKAFEERLANEDVKLTTAEYLKLLQLEQETEPESPNAIEVTWVEPNQSDEK